MSIPSRPRWRVLGVLYAAEKSGRDKLQGVLRYAHEKGDWDLHIFKHYSQEDSLGRLRDDLDRQGSRTVDGIVLSNIQDTTLLTYILNRFPIAPVIFLDSNAPAVRTALTRRRHLLVTLDPRAIGQTALDHFVRQGFRHLAYVGTTDVRDWSRDRGAAFARKARAAGFDCQMYERMTGNPSLIGNEPERMRAWLAQLPKPAGVLAANDDRAKETMDLCASAGLRVPHDVAVLGVDNDEIVCENTSPRLSSILPDFEGGGYLVAGRLNALMTGMAQAGATGAHYGVKQVVQRASSVYIQPSNPVATAMLEFVRDQACSGIGVMDVARHLRVSRRLAEVRFREAYGCSILEKIQEIRLERVRSLLGEGHLPISEIGARCGYSTENYLKGLFKRRFGMTMRDYRRRVTAEPRPLGL